MFAIQYSRFGGPDVLGVGPFAEPHAGPGEIRIAVRASGVAPVDTVLRAGHLRPNLGFPHVPGVDAAGVVDEVGDGAEDVAIGDEVFGAVDVMGLGGGPPPDTGRARSSLPSPDRRRPRPARRIRQGWPVAAG